MLIYNNFRLRLLDKSDLVFVKELRENPETSEFLGTFCMLSSSSQENWFESLQKDKSKCYMIFEKIENKQTSLIGLVRITDIDYINRSMIVGGDITPEQRGNGYAKSMYQLIFHYAFDCMNMHRLSLFVLENNAVAINLYKKLGFIQEGVLRQAIYKNGKYLDYIIMGMLKNDNPTNLNNIKSKKSEINAK